MKLIRFIEITKLKEKRQEEQASLLCYYHYKNTMESCFDMQAIGVLFSEAGLNAINATRVKNSLIKKGRMRLVEGLLNTLTFNTITIEEYEMQYAFFWEDYIDSDGEVLDEKKFCGKRKHLDKLISQMNCCYKNNCFDACAVIMRRFFEVLLVLAFQHHEIDSEIKDVNNRYFMLEKIINTAKDNKTLKLSNIKFKYDTIRSLGNFSAHGITYVASKKDIDDVKMIYRVAVEELFYKAGLYES